jgi:hypothetical protein
VLVLFSEQNSNNHPGTVSHRATAARAALFPPFLHLIKDKAIPFSVYRRLAYTHTPSWVLT